MTRRLWGRAFVGGEIRDKTLITIEEGQIVNVRSEPQAPPDSVTVHELIVPGFIDLHVHGGDGADFMDGSDEAVGRVTSSGAQNIASVRPADIHEIGALLAVAPQLRWIITVAPEIEGVRALIEHFRGRMIFSIGHTAADYSDAVLALEWGASHFTHLFNAMTGMHHREPGVVGAALVSTDATAELIADGIHVHPAVLRVATRAMPNRIALITDAVRACGMPEGLYKLYQHEFRVTADGAARLSDGTLAGSTLTMQRAVQNMVELAGLPIEMVLPLATEIPARILGVSDRKGKIAAGYDADLVTLTPKFEVPRVLVRGREIV